MVGIFYSREETYDEHLQKKFREFVEKDLDITQEKCRELSKAELIAKRIPPFKGLYKTIFGEPQLCKYEL